MAYETRQVFEQLRKMNFYINKKCGWLLAEKRRHDQEENGFRTNPRSKACNPSVVLKASTSTAQTEDNISVKKKSKLVELKSRVSKPTILSSRVLKEKIILSTRAEPEPPARSSSNTNCKSFYQPWS